MSNPKRAGGLIFSGHRRVGKSVVAGGAARCLQRAGRRVAVFKPIAFEAARTRNGLVSRDAEFLSRCIESKEPLHHINPVPLADALPPAWHAQLPPQAEPQALIAAAAALQRQSDVLVVEGADGLMLPYAPAFSELDLIRILDLVLIWVMPAQLAAVGPALDAIELARRREVRVGGLVVNGDVLAVGNTEPETLIEGLSRSTDAPVLAIVGWDEGTSVEASVLGDDVLYSLWQVGWDRLLQTPPAAIL